VINRGRVPVVLRVTGVYWQTGGEVGHTWEMTPEMIIPPGGSFVTAGQEADEWWEPTPDGERRRVIEAPLVGWAQLDSGRFVESKPGLVLESMSRFPIALPEPLTYYRAERWWEVAMRAWLSVQRERLAQTPTGA
jgi:hypothetical protein